MGQKMVKFLHKKKTIAAYLQQMSDKYMLVVFYVFFIFLFYQKV
jgi:hypothetical protein